MASTAISTGQILYNSAHNITKAVAEIETIIPHFVEIMEEKRITTLVVINDKNVPIGYLNLHDILPHYSTQDKIVFPKALYYFVKISYYMKKNGYT